MILCFGKEKGDEKFLLLPSVTTRAAWGLPEIISLLQLLHLQSKELQIGLRSSGHSLVLLGALLQPDSGTDPRCRAQSGEKAVLHRAEPHGAKHHYCTPTCKKLLPTGNPNTALLKAL